MSKSTISPHKIAVDMARAIFSLGDEPDSQCNRLQFMGGDFHDDSEVSQGGLCEAALTHVIYKAMIEASDKECSE